MAVAAGGGRRVEMAAEWRRPRRKAARQGSALGIGGGATPCMGGHMCGGVPSSKSGAGPPCHPSCPPLLHAPPHLLLLAHASCCQALRSRGQWGVRHGRMPSVCTRLGEGGGGR